MQDENTPPCSIMSPFLLLLTHGFPLIAEHFLALIFTDDWARHGDGALSLPGRSLKGEQRAPASLQDFEPASQQPSNTPVLTRRRRAGPRALGRLYTGNHTPGRER